MLGVEEDKEVIYIGQAGNRKNSDGILCRLYEHKRNIDKSYWNEAIVITTSNNSFGPTEISYLENRFYNIATDVKRVIVKNSVEPTAGNITEEKECELEDNVLQENIVFNSPSYAAAFVTGNRENGLTVWKNVSGKKIKEVETE